MKKKKKVTLLSVWKNVFRRLFATDNIGKKLQNHDWDHKASSKKSTPAALRGAGTRTVQKKKEKDIDAQQEQEMISDRPTHSTVDRNV